MTADFTPPDPIDVQAKEIVDAVKKRLDARFKLEGKDPGNNVIVILDGGRVRDMYEHHDLGRNLYATIIDDANFVRGVDPYRPMMRTMQPPALTADDYPTLTPKQKQQAKAREKTHENVRRKPPRSL